MTAAAAIKLETTWSSPTNIAVIKYWGKAEKNLNLPLNSSVSVTLHQDDLQTLTTIRASKTAYDRDRFYLNDVEQDISSNSRMTCVLREMRALAREEWKDYKFCIVSKNTFPTAAGLASSASGFACLVAALADLLDVKEQFPGRFSTIARQGSGSACRSLYGGLVRWDKGCTAKKGLDSKAVQVFDECHWPTLEAIICVVNDKAKETSSTQGMVNSTNTSRLLDFRAREVVQERLEKVEEAYRNRNFQLFGEIAMMDSNQFHAICLDTYPPIFYMNETSKDIIHLVEKFNEFHQKIVAAYTFDAGPNAVIFVEKENRRELLSLLLYYYRPSWKKYFYRTFVRGSQLKDHVDMKLHPKLLQSIRLVNTTGSLRMLFHTKVGPGVLRRGEKESLIDSKTGLPFKNDAGVISKLQKQLLKSCTSGTAAIVFVAFATVSLYLVRKR